MPLARLTVSSTSADAALLFGHGTATSEPSAGLLWRYFAIALCLSMPLNCCADVGAHNVGARELKEQSHRGAPNEEAAASKECHPSVHVLFIQTEVAVVPLANAPCQKSQSSPEAQDPIPEDRGRKLLEGQRNEACMQ